MPWAALDYVPEQMAYVVPFTREQLEAAPSDSIAELTGEETWTVRDQAYSYWGVTPYWI